MFKSLLALYVIASAPLLFSQTYNNGGGGASITAGASTPGSCVAPSLFYNTVGTAYYGCTGTSFSIFQSSSSGVNTVSGTTRQITASTAAGTVTLSLPVNLLFPGNFTAAAGTTSNPSFNVPIGVAPTSPTSGDFWNLSGVLQFYDGSANQSLMYRSTVLGSAQMPTFTGDVTNSALAMTVAKIQGTVVSGTTGTTNVVFSNSPTLVTPTLGAAIATTINKYTFTTPATGSTITLADGKTFTLNNSITFAGTDATTVTFQGTDTYVGRATTDTLTNKTLTSPVLTTPALGVATATTINKVTLTQPATGSTLTILNGKTLTANNSITFAGTDATTTTLPSTSQTIPGLAQSNAYSAGTQDASGAVHTLPAVKGVLASIPSTCTVGELYFATDATAGQNLYECATTNTFTQQLNSGGGGGGTPGGSTTQVQYNNAGAFAGITGATTNGTALTLVAPVLGTPASATLTNATGLPVNSGISGLGTGVATLLATPSSANLLTALTTSTGTGLAVFGTSPTLVTPALGTPASGVGTNLTGIPLTSAVIGVNPLANGGTNSTDAASNGGIVWSNATQHKILAGTATANQTILSGASATPSWTPFSIPATIAAHQTLVATSTTAVVAKTIPDCQDSAGNHINYTQSTDLYSCGTTASSSATTLTTVTFSTTPTFTRTTATQEWIITLTGNVSSSTLASASAADLLIFHICQDATGGRTFTWPTGFGQAAVISPTLSICTTQSFYWDGTNAQAITGGVTTDATLLITGTTSAAPATPVSGSATFYVDSTSKNLAVINDAGTVNHGIQTKAVVTHQVLQGVANDGSSTQSQLGISDLASSTSAQLAAVLSDETGTGSAVFSTSPSLVTPALGTPASGTMTNVTGLPPAAVTSTQGNGAKFQLSTGSTTTNDCVKFDANGNTIDAGSACGSGSGGSAGATLFSTTGSTTATAASATSLIGTATGSTTVPVNTFTAGQVLEIVAQGYYTTPATAASLTIDLKIGGTVRITTGAVVQVASVTTGVWTLSCAVTTRTTGGSGTQIANCIYSATGSSLTAPPDAPMQVSSAWTIDTTATEAIDIAATWSTTTGAPTITSTNAAAWIPGAPVTSVFGVTGAVGNLTGDVTSSGVATTIAANAVTAAKMAVVDTRRVCDIPINDTSGSAITSGQMGPQSRICFIPAAATIVEMDVNADAGTPNIIVGRNRAGTIVNIVSGALATAASGGIACTNTGGTTGINTATTCSSTLQNTGLNAGDYLELVSGTPGGTAKFFVAHIIYTVN